MGKQSQKRSRKIKKLIIATTLCAVLLGVSTYAWFIGMKKVNVSSFDVTIATTESLTLSLDGDTFSQTVAINGTNFDDDTNTVYTGHTNTWGGAGLVPVSTIGQIDSTTSRLVMYEKGSLTTTAGGYRLMASQVQNTGAAETDGYVAFDLFVKNLSGEAYYAENNVLNEEAIYLNVDSTVDVSATGDNEENSGIENSVRVAFAQIGRVEADSDATTVTGIDCETAGDVTGICDRNATIWEPNDTAHVGNAINWYNTSCLARTAEDVTADSSYTGACETIAAGDYVPTYAISGVIDYTDNIDVYDGEALNGYTDSVSATAADGKLVETTTFTDTMKVQSLETTGVDRPQMMTLAPNSITKIRVYVYLEGQDIDNYDFASLGKQISVNFGFTKERFFDGDVDYDTANSPTLPNDVIRP